MQELGCRKATLSPAVIYYCPFKGSSFIVVLFINCYVSLSSILLITIRQVGYVYNQLSLGNSSHLYWETVANSACHLFILWLLYCICLSFTLVLGLDMDIIVSVPEFTYLLNLPPQEIFLLTVSVSLLQFIIV